MSSQVTSDSIRFLHSVFRELGGEASNWHPYDLVGEDSTLYFDPFDDRPTDVEDDWNRPNLEPYSEEIGRSVEEYLAENYFMERTDGKGDIDFLDFNPYEADEVDLVITEGRFKGSLVQSKGAAIKVTRGTYDGTEEHKTSFGGIYMNEENMRKLAERDRPAFLHTAVHYPQFEFEKEPPVPVLKLEGGDKPDIKTALVGELALPVNEVVEKVEFYPSGYKNWNWPDPYEEDPNPEEIVERWYENTDITN